MHLDDDDVVVGIKVEDNEGVIPVIQEQADEIRATRTLLFEPPH